MSVTLSRADCAYDYESRLELLALSFWKSLPEP